VLDRQIPRETAIAVLRANGLRVTVDGDRVTVEGDGYTPEVNLWRESDPIGSKTIERLARRYSIPRQRFYMAVA